MDRAKIEGIIMRTPEQMHETYTKSHDVQPNPESHTVIYRPEIDLGSVALITVKTRLDVLADEREKIIDSRPETD